MRSDLVIQPEDNEEDDDYDKDADAEDDDSDKDEISEWEIAGLPGRQRMQTVLVI